MPSETIAVFSHSDPIKLAVAFYMGMPLDLFQRLEISPASISELDFQPVAGAAGADERLRACAAVAERNASGREPGGSEAEESPAAKGALEEQVIRTGTRTAQGPNRKPCRSRTKERCRQPEAESEPRHVLDTHGKGLRFVDLW